MLFSRSAEPPVTGVSAAGSAIGGGAIGSVRAERWWSVAAYASIAAATAAGFIAETGTFFRGSDWSPLAAFHDGPSWEPFDGALSLTSGAVFGIVAPLAEWTFWPYRLVAAVALALALVAVYRLATRVAGPAVGFVATALLASFTHATPLITQPFAMRFPLSIAMVVATAHLLDVADSDDRAARHISRADLGAVGLFAAALATSVVGLAAVPVVVTALMARRAIWTCWVVHLAPLALWLAWFIWRGSLDTEPWSWTSRGHYLANLLGRSFQHLACNSATFGAVAAAGVIAVLWTDPERRLSPAWRPLRWLGAAGVFAVVTAYRNGSVWLRPLGGHPPDSHSWVIAAFVVLAVVESVRHRHRLLHESWQQAGLGALAVAIALSSVTLHHAVADYRESAQDGHGLDVDTLTAVESLNRLPDDSWAISIDYGGLSAQDYQDVVGHLGSPLDAIGAARDDSQTALRNRDEIVAVGLGLTAAAGDCQWTSDPTSQLEVDGPARVVIASLDQNASTGVFIARLARASINADPFAEVEAGQTAIIALPDPGDGYAWTVWVEGFGVLGTCLD